MTEDAALAEWAQRLAGQVAPDEADLAGDMAVAYAHGGRERDELFARAASEPGAFGIETVVMAMPVMFDALSLVAGRLIDVLRDPLLANVLSASSIVAAWLGTRAQNRPTAAPVPSSTAEAEAERRLVEVRVDITHRFDLRGVDDGEARAEKLLAELLADPAGAADFLAALTRARDQRPR